MAYARRIEDLTDLTRSVSSRMGVNKALTRVRGTRFILNCKLWVPLKSETLTRQGRQGIDCLMNTAAILISGIICG
jgi:hypothetical protein